jgi:hypothetical protein
MTEITAEELKENFDEILERSIEGEQFLITTLQEDLVLIPYGDYYNDFFQHNDWC